MEKDEKMMDMIDRLVYELYELTPEEVKIVEGGEEGPHPGPLPGLGEGGVADAGEGVK